MGLLPVFRKGDILEFRQMGHNHMAIVDKEPHVVHVFERGRPFEPSELMVFPHLLSENVIIPTKKINFGVREDYLDYMDLFQTYLGFGMAINNWLDDVITPKDPKIVIETARDLIDEWQYDRQHKNEQHFVNLCRYGLAISQEYGYILKTSNVFSASFPVVYLGLVQISLPSVTVGYGTVGIRHGLVAELRFLSVELGPFEAKLGLSLSTTCTCTNGIISIRFMGSGITIGREFSISLLGSSIGFKLW